jgi:hypothetical protein
VKNGFDFTTDTILQRELDSIHEALIEQEISMSDHAVEAARQDHIPLVKLLETVLVGIATSKDLPNNALDRVPGINFEYRLEDQRLIRVKVAWFDGYWIITTHTV